MDIRTSPVFACKLGINPSAVTEGAGLAFISFNEFVPLDEADADAADGRSLYVAAAAGGVATPAGLFENLRIELFELVGREPLHDAMALAYRRIVEGFFIVIGSLFVTHAAGLQVVRRSLDESFMGRFTIRRGVVTLVAEFAAHGKVDILSDQFLVDQISPVHLLRLNWRRRPCSPFALARLHGRWLEQHFQDPFVCMADLAAARACGDG